MTKHIKLSDTPRLSAVVSLNCNFCIAKCHSRRNLGTKDVDIHSSSHLSIHPSIHPSPKGQSEQLANRLAERIGCRCLSLPYTAVVLVQVWGVPLRRPRPARDEGTGGLVLRALPGVHHDCCLSPLIDRSYPVALVSCFRSDCVSQLVESRGAISLSLSLPLLSASRNSPASHFRFREKRQCARLYEVGAREILKNRFVYSYIVYIRGEKKCKNSVFIFKQVVLTVG